MSSPNLTPMIGYTFVILINVATALGPLACPSRSARPRNRLNLT